uniref:Uncharacterized protein LOC103493568 n=1 Tax=Rhizophora mucronata TaxID=61149 RepID=A0A2P2JVK9_RHIMU
MALATDASLLPKPHLLLPSHAFHFSSSRHYAACLGIKAKLPFSSKPLLSLSPPFPSRIVAATFNSNHAAAAVAASTCEIDMVRNKQGIYAPKQSKVVVLWDLDNKPPRGPPYHAAMALKQVAQKFGEVVDMSAYANRHAFIHLPQWVVEERRERKQLDILERKGLFVPSQLYVCGVCGRKCKTNLDLKKHFTQLHERERQKKLNRMRSLKGKKQQRYKERFISRNNKYNEEARRLLTPKAGYGLAAELRRAGVYVKTVEDKPQAADWALKRQIEHSMSKAVDWLVLVSDDSDFSEILRKAREASLGTVVVGDRDRALGRHADLWVPWIGIENGEVTDKDLVPRRQSASEEDLEIDDGNGMFTITHFSDEDIEASDLESVFNEFTEATSDFGDVWISAFSEGEEEENEDYVMWDNEDEDIEEEDGYL